MAEKNFSMDDVRALLENAAANGQLAKNVDVETVLGEMKSAQAQSAAAQIVKQKFELVDEKISDDDVNARVAFLFEVAEWVSGSIPVTAGDPNGKQDRSKRDRNMIGVETPNGSLQIHLYR